MGAIFGKPNPSVPVATKVAGVSLNPTYYWYSHQWTKMKRMVQQHNLWVKIGCNGLWGWYPYGCSIPYSVEYSMVQVTHSDLLSSGNIS